MRKLLDRLSDKWVTLVLDALARGPLRHSDLSRTIAGDIPEVEAARERYDATA